MGVSFDTVEENRSFAEKFSFPFPLLCDADRRIGLAYGACEDAAAEYPKRISYVIDPNGIVKQVYGKVDASLHPEEVLAAL